MKKKTVFRLSSEAMDLLDTLCRRHKLNPDAVIECLLAKRKVSDRKHNLKRYKRALKYAQDNLGPRVSRARYFQAGYAIGWRQFQTRHPDIANLLYPTADKKFRNSQEPK